MTETEVYVLVTAIFCLWMSGYDFLGWLPKRGNGGDNKGGCENSDSHDDHL